MKLEIIMFNMSTYTEWEKGVVNRNYHIFNNLLHRPEVKTIVAVDFLPFTIKRAIRNYGENYIDNAHKKNKQVIYKDATTQCVEINGYPSNLYIFKSIDSVFSHTRVISKLNTILHKISSLTHNSSEKLTRIVWSYFPMYVAHYPVVKGREIRSDKDGIPCDATIFDAVDNWLLHPSFIKYKDRLRQNYKVIADKTDLIFTVSEPLLDFFKAIGREKNLFWIPNGVDVNHFTRERENTLHDKLFNTIPGPIIGYVGTIQNRVDMDLLEYIAKNNPKKSFVFIGPIWKGAHIKKLKKYKNVYFLGRKPYTSIPSYITRFNACIIPHKLDRFITYTYSLKMLDYLMAGKPIISVDTVDVKNFSEYIYIAKDYKDFNNTIDVSLRSDTIEMKKKRIQRAKKEDWKLKVDTMMEIITKHVGKQIE